MVATPVAESLVQPVQKTLTDISHCCHSATASFIPATDHRTYSVMATSYSAVAVLHPLLVQLPTEAPNVRLRIQPFAEEYAEQLTRHQIDLIIPREMVPSGPDLCRSCTPTVQHPGRPGAPRCGREHLGRAVQRAAVPRDKPRPATRPGRTATRSARHPAPRRGHHEFELAPFLIRGTRLITLIPNRRAASPRRQGLRLLEPPMELPSATEMMVWTKRMDDDPGHAWLRQRMHHFADAYSQDTPPAPAAGDRTGQEEPGRVPSIGSMPTHRQELLFTM